MLNRKPQYLPIFLPPLMQQQLTVFSWKLEKHLKGSSTLCECEIKLAKVNGVYMESLLPKQCPVVKNSPCTSHLLLRTERSGIHVQCPVFFFFRSLPKELAFVLIILELWRDWDSPMTWGRMERGAGWKYRKYRTYLTCVPYRLRRWGLGLREPQLLLVREWMDECCMQADRQELASFSGEKELVESTGRGLA